MEPNLERRPGTAKWTLGCTKCPFDYVKIPNVQQYTQYNFYKPRTKETITNYNTNFLKTDHIGMRIPEIKNKNSEFLKIKAEYSSQSDSNSYWVPYHKGVSVNNASSKNYNIINFQPIENKVDTRSLAFKNINFKSKGVCEYADLTRTYIPNFSPTFKNYFEENPKRFCKFNGIFSHMYDAAKKSGGINKVFG